MIIGYARLSGTPDSNAIDTARSNLFAAGAQTVHLDTSAAETEREKAVSDCQNGDVLLALSPTLLSATLDTLIDVASRLAGNGASLRVHQIAGSLMLDTATPTGSMMLGALGLLAAFNQPASPIETATAPSAMGESFAPRRTRGRPPTASTQAQAITRMREAGMRATDIADRLKICRASVYRVLNMETPTSPSQASIAAHQATA